MSHQNSMLTSVSSGMEPVHTPEYIRTVMSPVISSEVQFTKDWWLRVLGDQAKLTAWLQKLQITEISGYHDWVNVFIPTYKDSITSRTETILLNIANDELEHSSLLSEIMKDRGISLGSRMNSANLSAYWDTMYKEIDDLSSACAVNYYGEDLAAFRFEVIAEMPQTPGDIKEFLRIALPDEQFHRETLKRLAGEAAIEKVKVAHERASGALRSGR